MPTTDPFDGSTAKLDNLTPHELRIRDIGHQGVSLR